MIGILVPITLFVLTAIILWKYFDSRHIERKAIIDKGLNPSDYKELYKHEAFATNPLSSLKLGLLAMFVGAGVFIGLVLRKWYYIDEAIFPSLILIMGGIGLIVFYLLASKKMKGNP
jgi:hypothetical protein